MKSVTIAIKINQSQDSCRTVAWQSQGSCKAVANSRKIVMRQSRDSGETANSCKAVVRQSRDSCETVARQW
jgi:hypothetical protein